MSQVSVTNEDAFLSTLIEYLESEGEPELVSLLKPAKLIFNYGSSFNHCKWNQCDCDIEIKVSIPAKKKLEQQANKSKIYKACAIIYEETDDYAFGDLHFGVLQHAIQDIQTDSNSKFAIIAKEQVYHNFIQKIHKMCVDEIEKRYLLEACDCAIHGNRLAAATMLGCAAEQLLFLLCKAYLQYLKNGHGTLPEQTNFEKNVVLTDKAHKRLDAFKRTVQNKEKLFKPMGLDNSNLHFSFLDIIRQVRNESGHPTGIIVGDEDLNTMFGNYQLLIDRIYPIITKLPEIMVGDIDSGHII